MSLPYRNRILLLGLLSYSKGSFKTNRLHGVISLIDSSKSIYDINTKAAISKLTAIYITILAFPHTVKWTIQVCALPLLPRIDSTPCYLLGRLTAFHVLFHVFIVRNLKSLSAFFFMAYLKGCQRRILVDRCSDERQRIQGVDRREKNPCLQRKYVNLSEHYGMHT
jgi:hypothetical protein